MLLNKYGDIFQLSLGLDTMLGIIIYYCDSY